MDRARLELKNLCFEAYLSAMRGDEPRTVLDKLQDAYWQGLDMEPEEDSWAEFCNTLSDYNSPF